MSVHAIIQSARLLALAVPLLASTAASDLGANNFAVSGPLVRGADARLVWADEFDGPRVDPTKWTYDTSRNKQGWYNNEKQYYSADFPQLVGNAQVGRGRLTIEARKETLDPKRYPDWSGQAYTSAKLVTAGRASWRYGFFEIRAKLPCGRGTWPAIWMMPDDASGGWPMSGEIDIMEQVGFAPDTIHATLHTGLFNHVKGTQRGATTQVPDACGAFHRYQMDWRADAITIGIDDRAYLRVANDQPGGRAAWPFATPFHLILNVAVGGDWGGAQGIDDAALPRRMEVDYVRVWQVPGR